MDPCSHVTRQLHRPPHRSHAFVHVAPSDHSSNCAGHTGTYAMSFVLGVPGRDQAFTSFNWDDVEQSGDSLLKLPEEASGLRMLATFPSGSRLTLEVEGNEQGNVARIRTELHATSFDDAFERAHDVISLHLSRWSWEYDVPLAVRAMKALDMSTSGWRWLFEVIATRRGMQRDRAGYVSSEFLPLISCYREGLNSGEPLWQALSFYRAMEGAASIGAIRESAAAMSKRQRQRPRIPATQAELEAQGADDYTCESLTPYLGWPFQRYRDEARHRVRNAVAHLDIDARHIVSDRWDDQWAVRRFLPGLRWVARRWIEHEMQSNTNV